MCYCDAMNGLVDRVMDLSELRNWLKGLWWQHGYSSMSAFAEAAGVAPAAYIGWVERGTKPKRPQLRKVAEFVNVDPDWAWALAASGPQVKLGPDLEEEPDRNVTFRKRTAEDDAIRDAALARLEVLAAEMLAEMKRLRGED